MAVTLLWWDVRWARPNGTVADDVDRVLEPVTLDPLGEVLPLASEFHPRHRRWADQLAHVLGRLAPRTRCLLCDEALVPRL